MLSRRVALLRREQIPLHSFSPIAMFYAITSRQDKPKRILRLGITSLRLRTNLCKFLFVQDLNFAIAIEIWCLVVHSINIPDALQKITC